MDIIVTTPKSAISSAKEEAALCIKNNGGFYFRRFNVLPKNINIGDRVFYVENNNIVGFCVIDSIQKEQNKTCEVTEKSYSGNFIVMRADSWHWIEPIPYKSFQGFRYFNDKFVIKGGWKDNA